MHTNHNQTITICAAIVAVCALLTLCSCSEVGSAVLLQEGDAAPYTGYLLPIPTEVVLPADDK
jgi:hypothetical protein